MATVEGASIHLQVLQLDGLGRQRVAHLAVEHVVHGVVVEVGKVDAEQAPVLPEIVEPVLLRFPGGVIRNTKIIHAAVLGDDHDVTVECPEGRTAVLLRVVLAPQQSLIDDILSTARSGKGNNEEKRLFLRHLRKKIRR